jgi:hypothetical protein
MARLVWLVFMAAVIGTLLAGASFGAATFGVGELLGAPPPDMGNRSVTFLWEGVPNRRDHARAWRADAHPRRARRHGLHFADRERAAGLPGGSSRTHQGVPQHGILNAREGR